MRRCLEYAQLRRYFHCYHLAPRSPLRRLRYDRSLLWAKPHDRHALPSLNSRLLSSAPPTPDQDASPPCGWPDVSSPPLPAAGSDAKVRHENNTESYNGHRCDPGHWVSLLEQFLPSQLRRTDKHEPPSISHDGSDLNKLIGILTKASASEDIDILGFLVLSQRRHKAAVHLADVLLNPLAAVPSVPDEEQLPSNISWPVALSPSALRHPLELEHELHVDKRAAIAPVRASQSQYSERDRQRVLDIVWPFLAKLVIASTKGLPEDARDIMNTVHQILARMHSLDLVPPTVYTYSPPQGTTTIQKPPILNLLNSRILSTLSDAVWRAQQDDAIAQAREKGKPLRDVSHHPPSSRFRPRVKELGPELWLEFILWCSVEGGLASTGTRIIDLLREDADNRWSAINWTAGQAIDNETPWVDWDRVKRRHDSPVGQREAYSCDQPFEEMPRRTISAEVILALVDCLVTSLDAGSAHSGSAVERVAREILQLVSLLKPHGLPPAYFDYLTVRFLQTETVRMQGGPDTLRDWVMALSQLCSLDAVKTQSRSRASFDFDAVIERSELQAGLLHQALQIYVDLNLVTKAVDTFTDIQKLVDVSKLETIGEFLASSIRPRNGFFTSRARGHIDFNNSHGQLPMYKMAPFLKLVADARLFGLGDWLLFSEDVDGPLIPFSAYRQPSIAIALCRYAAAKDDRSLIQSILLVRKGTSRRPTVSLLRALVNSQIILQDWDNAVFLLQELKAAGGGGYSPDIVAHLAAAILRLEIEPPGHDRDNHVDQATRLLRDILEGRYNPSAGDFRIDQKLAFKRQTGLLLRFLENVPDSGVQALSTQFGQLFPLSNEALLPPNTFNILLSAVVESRGALEGRRMWDMFCKVADVPTSPTAVEGEPFHPTDVFVEDDATLTESSSDPDRNKARPASRVGSAPADVGSSRRRLSEVVDRPSLVTGMDSSSEDIPFVRTETREESSSTNPIVIPNMRTLQIIVGGALAEKQAEPGVSRETLEELDQLLQWAGPLFKGGIHSTFAEDATAKAKTNVVGAEQAKGEQSIYQWSANAETAAWPETKQPTATR
ncbi:hypothetical protein A1O3_06782 [Capronia epimyces CBS 606.96]|uniref:Sec39 domain-containing protein n=1 Tax=Capronia epimyces CBS 606.96 TaxID=1182542 RepID=W9Y021_9EURO|nr:uncharacterized protein A1O3_06782 [Capronia epimyces CBS 606.96]EXJ82965.1 hypothetical protein A1O3_06782 [Capronia epimyces CBS 606.96]